MTINPGAKTQVGTCHWCGDPVKMYYVAEWCDDCVRFINEKVPEDTEWDDLVVMMAEYAKEKKSELGVDKDTV